MPVQPAGNKRPGKRHKSTKRTNLVLRVEAADMAARHIRQEDSRRSGMWRKGLMPLGQLSVRLHRID